MEPLLEGVNVSKFYGTLPALQQFSFQLYAGEVLGLTGESGAGKSVLAMLIAGRQAPDAGALYFSGRRLRSPFSARTLGISFIPQKPALIEQMDVARNIILGNEPGLRAGLGWLDILSRRRGEKLAADILAQMDVPNLDLHDRISNLSSEQRQIVSIARSLAVTPTLVVVDDPAPLLSYAHQQRLLALIQKWRNQGVAVLFATSNLDHLFAVADRILVMRRGRLVNEMMGGETSLEEIVAAVVGTTDQQHLTPIIWALRSYYRTREQADKLRDQMAGLESSVSVLDAANRQLIEQLAEQVNALDRANVVLQDAHRRLLTEREDERKSLARELHDQTLQDLLSLNYDLEDIRSEAAATPALRRAIMEARDNVRSIIADLRLICSDLRPPTIDSFGLGSALESFTNDWSRRADIALTLDVEPGLEQLPEDLQLSVFRMVQEALNNVRKHSSAGKAIVSLRHTSPRTLLVTVADDGCGLPKGFSLSTLAGKGHYGLLGISERVTLVGGRLKLRNQASGGLLIQIEIPHPRLAAEQAP